MLPRLRRLALVAALAVLAALAGPGTALAATTATATADVCAALNIDAADVLREQLAGQASVGAVAVLLPGGQIPAPTPAAITSARSQADCAADPTAANRGARSRTEVVAQLCVALDAGVLRDLVGDTVVDTRVTTALNSPAGDELVRRAVTGTRNGLDCDAPTTGEPTTTDPAGATSTDDGDDDGDQDDNDRDDDRTTTRPSGYTQVRTVPSGAIETGRA